MLSVQVMGPHEAARRALEERVGTIGEFAVLPADGGRRRAADVLLVTADRPGIKEARRIAARAAGVRQPVLLVVDEPFEGLLSVLWPVAGGIVFSSAPDRELADCAALVARHCTVLPERVLDGRPLPAARRLFGREGGRHPRETLDRLSPRELEVLELVGAGRTNAEIAALLWVSSNTVRSHVQRLMRKLGLRNRLCLIIFAHEVRLMIPAAPRGKGGGGGDHRREDAEAGSGAGPRVTPGRCAGPGPAAQAGAAAPAGRAARGSSPPG